jgi:hypothetical protein
LTVQPGEYFCILTLGSEATVSLRLLASDSSATTHEAPGTVIMQHGDVLGMQAGLGLLEVSVQMDGFGIGESAL